MFARWQIRFASHIRTVTGRVRTFARSHAPQRGTSNENSLQRQKNAHNVHAIVPKLDIGGCDASTNLIIKSLFSPIFFLLLAMVEVSGIFVSLPDHAQCTFKETIPMPWTTCPSSRKSHTEIVYSVLTFNKEPNSGIIFKIFLERVWPEMHSSINLQLRAGLALKR